MSVLSSFIESTIPGLSAGVRTAMPYLEQLTMQGTVLDPHTIKAISLGGIPKAVPVLSANEIIRQVRAAGFGVNRQMALRVIKGFKDQITAHTYIQGLTGGIRPLASQVPLAGKAQKFKYYVRTLVVVRDSTTGELVTQNITITSNSLITKSYAQQQAAIMVMNSQQYNYSEVYSVQVVTYTQTNPYL